MIGIAEIYADAEELLQLLVVPEEQVIVSGKGFEFRKSLFDAEECVVHILDRNLEYLFDKEHSDLSVCQSEQYSFAAFSRNNEVRFSISQSLSFVDMRGSFVDEDSIS